MNIIYNGHGYGRGKTHWHHTELFYKMLVDKSLKCAIFSQSTRDSMNMVVRENLKGYCKVCIDLTLQDVNSRLIDTEFTSRQEAIDKWLGVE